MVDKKELEKRKITTPKFRASFVQVFEPKANLQGKMTYSLTMLFDKKVVKEGGLADLQRIVKEAVAEKFGKDVSLKDIDFVPFKDGDLKDYDGYKDCITVNAASQFPPVVVDDQLQVIIDPNEFYSGCFAKASVTAYAWENKFKKKGVSVGLQNLQKVADGEPFSGRGNPEDDFDPIIPEAIEVANTDDLVGGMLGETPKNAGESAFGIEGL